MNDCLISRKIHRDHRVIFFLCSSGNHISQVAGLFWRNGLPPWIRLPGCGWRYCVCCQGLLLFDGDLCLANAHYDSIYVVSTLHFIIIYGSFALVQVTVYVVISLGIDESPRWLVRVGRDKEAIKVLDRILKVNKGRHAELPKDLHFKEAHEEDVSTCIHHTCTCNFISW